MGLLSAIYNHLIKTFIILFIEAPHGDQECRMCQKLTVLPQQNNDSVFHLLCVKKKRMYNPQTELYKRHILFESRTLIDVLSRVYFPFLSFESVVSKALHRDRMHWLSGYHSLPFTCFLRWLFIDQSVTDDKQLWKLCTICPGAGPYSFKVVRFWSQLIRFRFRSSPTK